MWTLFDKIITWLASTCFHIETLNRTYYPFSTFLMPFNHTRHTHMTFHPSAHLLLCFQHTVSWPLILLIFWPILTPSTATFLNLLQPPDYCPLLQYVLLPLCQLGLNSCPPVPCLCFSHARPFTFPLPCSPISQVRPSDLSLNCLHMCQPHRTSHLAASSFSQTAKIDLLTFAYMPLCQPHRTSHLQAPNSLQAKLSLLALVSSVSPWDCATKRRITKRRNYKTPNFKTSNCKTPNCKTPNYKTSNLTERWILQNVEIQNVESYRTSKYNTSTMQNVENDWLGWLICFEILTYCNPSSRLFQLLHSLL